MKAIETIYNGYRFRSRLEARWAVFFDAMGLEYEYEPEGFELDGDLRYLPDFKLRYGPYVEVKPGNGYIPTWDELLKVMVFSGYHPLIVVNGLPEPRGYAVLAQEHMGVYYHQAILFYFHKGIIGDWFFCYPGEEYDIPELVAACCAAKQARFEHGENPARY